MLKLKFVIALLGILPLGAYAWNALGHQVIAQIAYTHMNPAARTLVTRYNRALDKVYAPQTLVNAAVWLDKLRYQDIAWFSTLHYMDLAFSDDASPLPPLAELNAVWALSKAQLLLNNKYAKDFDKGIALRLILHVVGDIHQPLHAATRISAEYPHGDRGANLVFLSRNRIAKNLHAYWDRGGGLLKPRHRYHQVQIESLATAIEKSAPCDPAAITIDPRAWAQEAHMLAVTKVYKQLPAHYSPDGDYQALTQTISAKQLALAGCRLAALINQVQR